MAEVLFCDIKCKDGGELKGWVDRDKKFIKTTSIGKYNSNEIADAAKSVSNELQKFSKGELSYINDASKSEMRIWSKEQAAAAKEYYLSISSKFKKVAIVYTSFTHQKSMEAAMGSMPDNLKFFSSENEAMKWVMS